jgi:hypothetical protein
MNWSPAYGGLLPDSGLLLTICRSCTPFLPHVSLSRGQDLRISKLRSANNANSIFVGFSDCGISSWDSKFPYKWKIPIGGTNISEVFVSKVDYFTHAPVTLASRIRIHWSALLLFLKKCKNEQTRLRAHVLHGHHFCKDSS